jgi:hypothetical protein
MPLRLVIENTPEDEIAPMPSHPSNAFIEAAIHTAKNSKAETRGTIIADICDVLGCRPKDLEFLFDQHSVPNRRRPVFGLELPDYRMSQTDLYKEAAE